MAIISHLPGQERITGVSQCRRCYWVLVWLPGGGDKHKGPLCPPRSQTLLFLPRHEVAQKCGSHLPPAAHTAKGSRGQGATPRVQGEPESSRCPPQPRAQIQQLLLLSPVSPHGLMVLHNNSEFSAGVQGSSLQVPLEALEEWREEPASAPGQAVMLTPTSTSSSTAKGSRRWQTKTRNPHHHPSRNLSTTSAPSKISQSHRIIWARKAL